MGLLLRQCFSAEQEAFFRDLRPKYIMTKLIKDGLISLTERDEILLKNEPKFQIQQLIRILSQKSDPKVFKLFVDALNENGAYSWLANKLVDKKKKLGYDDETKSPINLPYLLADGGVPSQTNYLFERKDLLNKIRDNLKEASGKRKWIILHGMIGCGKSVLAAEAIRDALLFQQYFSSGVCWIPVGKLKTDNAIFFRLQILWEKFNPNQVFPWANLELSSKSDEVRNATKAVKAAFSYLQSKDFLLILDDVWDSTVIKAFDIGCPTLVTTTNKGVVDTVKSFCSYIQFSDGLSLEESREFLSLHVNASPNDLPDEVNIIHQRCKGLPMVLSLIGGNLSQYGNRIERWRYWSKELEKGIAAAFERKRNVSGQLEYLNNTMKLIIDLLPKDLKDYYFDFALFEEDIFIPNKVLELLWNLDKFEVEDIMQELYKRSLVYLEEDHEQNCFMYSIHDVYLKFLKEECDQEYLKERHKKLVFEYLKFCENADGSMDYGLLPNDGYIYHFIGHHLYQADEGELFPKIFLDLNFLQNKLRNSAPWDVLYDFETYKDSFLNDFEEKEDMIAFIRRNAHLICRDDSDIKQLALFEPSDKTVYKNAKNAIIAKPYNHQTYYEWCNQENVPYWSQLSVKMEFGDLSVATFSPDNNLVATVGDSKTAVIWECTSGKVLETLIGHSDVINCCTFNSTGSLLATASSDKTVKIWHINNYILSSKRSSKGKIHIPMNLSIEDLNSKDTKTFSHHGEVLWCSFNPDSSLIVSSDSVGVICIWDCTAENLIWKFHHNDAPSAYPVNHCSFSPDSYCIATASIEDIKLWNYSTKTFEVILPHEVHVAQFCFSSDAKFIYSASGSSIWKWNLLNENSREELFRSIRQCLLCSCCLSPNGQFIAAGSSNSSVIIWNLNTKKVIANLKGHKGAVKIVEFSHDSSRLLSASEDGCSTIWDMSDCMATSMVSLENNLSVRFSDDLIIASSDQLNRIQVRTGIKGLPKFKSIGDQSDITACSLSYESSEVIYGTENGSVKVFKFHLDKTIHLFCHSAKVTYLTHVTNSQFISCSEDATLRVWNVDGTFVSLKGHLGPVVMCVPFNNGDSLLSCSDDGRLIVWNANFGEVVMKLEGHGNQKVNFCDVSADEKVFCSASSDQTIKLWNADHGSIQKTLYCDDCVRCCRFCPNAQFIVSGEDSGNIQIWKYSKGSFDKLSLGFVDGWVKDIQFSEDGSQILAVGESVKLFNKRDLKYFPTQTFILPGAFTCALWASPDFKILVFVHNSVLYILKTVL